MVLVLAAVLCRSSLAPFQAGDSDSQRGPRVSRIVLRLDARLDAPDYSPLSFLLSSTHSTAPRTGLNWYHE